MYFAPYAVKIALTDFYYNYAFISNLIQLELKDKSAYFKMTRVYFCQKGLKQIFILVRRKKSKKYFG